MTERLHHFSFWSRTSRSPIFRWLRRHGSVKNQKCFSMLFVCFRSINGGWSCLMKLFTVPVAPRDDALLMLLLLGQTSWREKRQRKVISRCILRYSTRNFMFYVLFIWWFYFFNWLKLLILQLITIVTGNNLFIWFDRTCKLIWLLTLERENKLFHLLFTVILNISGRKCGLTAKIGSLKSGNLMWPIYVGFLPYAQMIFCIE